MNWKLFLLAFLFPAAVFAQENEPETLFGSKDTKLGGFGAATGFVTSIDGETALVTGFRGGMIINNNFNLGAGIYNLQTVHRTENPEPLTGKKPQLDISYFGLEFEYVFFPEKLIHFTVYGFAGPGSITLKENWDLDDLGIDSDFDYKTDWFAVFQPAVNVEMNITEWMRVSVGGGYRFTPGVKYSYQGQEFDDAVASGPFGVINFKFGSFDFD